MGSGCIDPCFLDLGTSLSVVTFTIQLPEYAESFIRHCIHERELLNVGRPETKELCVTKVGHMKRILQAVKDLTM
jgi:hypothetical protein